jgi:hypothetical protein
LGTACCAERFFAAAFVGLRADDLAAALRGLAASAANWLAAVFATWVDFSDLLFAIALTPLIDGQIIEVN